MADRNTNWDRERDNERNDWREEAWRRGESEGPGERQQAYREYSGGGDRPEEQRRRYVPRGDYGPSAFNPGGGRDYELFGTGSRGYGTTWGGTGVHSEGRDLYRSDHYPVREGPYAGKGPKGYSRSDERIREDVCECLTRHSHVDASEIEVRVKDGEVTLTGTVDRREEKRMAEDAAERVPGVRDVHNQLRMHAPDNIQQGNAQRTNEQQYLEPAGSRRR